jgi:4-carboxymuconolactone decarboxylase
MMKPSSPEQQGDRMPPIPQAQWTAEQRAAAAELVAGPRGEVRGPFVPLLRSPELLDRSQKLGEYLRYRCQVPQRLRELAILTIGLHWKQGYEWAIHAPLAVQAGVEVALIESLVAGTLGTPAGHAADADSLLIVEFCQQLLRTHAVDDGCYARAKALLGEAGVVDLCALCGYYSLLAMVMNVARTPLPAGRTAPF